MITIKGNNNVDTMLRMYAAVHRSPEVEVRGSKTKNVRDMVVVFDALTPVITSFEHRKFNLAYAKREWQWYVGADKFDSSIEEHATMWKKLQQPDGSYYSNYGQYIFGRTPKDEGDAEVSQFDYVVDTLRADPNSRRASIVLLAREHLFPENTDVVCTYAINFAIENNRLQMTVMMRSNDVIFGFTNDAFCFSNLYMFVYALLVEAYPALRPGEYVHFTNSMHVYDRHYQMIARLANERTMNGYTVMNVPWPTADEVRALVDSKGKEGEGEYVEWLKA